MKKIPWWEPRIEGPETELVSRVLQSNYLNDGAVTEELEKNVAQILGAKFAVATTSGTTALFLALKALNVGPGDEVLVPDITFIATANAVSLAGATPVLVDIDPETLNISVDQIRKAISKKTRAILPVHISGRPAAMPAILDLAKKKKLAVIEDAAEALFSKGGGKFLGTSGDAGCFSFSPNKTITTGQGGMVVTNNELLAQRMRSLKDQGRPKRGTGGDDLHPTLGFNFKLTNLQAAVGMGQLVYLRKRTERLVRNYEIYQTELANCSGLRLLPFNVQAGEVPQWIDVVVENRDGLDQYLAGRGMDCRRFWHPLHTQTPYKSPGKHFPVASDLGKKALWLPSAFTLTDDDVKAVSSEIRKFYMQKTALPLKARGRRSA